MKLLKLSPCTRKSRHIIGLHCMETDIEGKLLHEGEAVSGEDVVVLKFNYCATCGKKIRE